LRRLGLGRRRRELGQEVKAEDLERFITDVMQQAAQYCREWPRAA
jgi:hypothetical protein